MITTSIFVLKTAIVQDFNTFSLDNTFSSLGPSGFVREVVFEDVN